MKVSRRRVPGLLPFRPLPLLIALAFAPPVGAPAASAAPSIGPLKFNDVMTAVVYGDLEGLNELLALGKWPDKPDSQGRTPLTVALSLRFAPLAEALLKAGADPHIARVQLSRTGESLDAALVALLDRYGAQPALTRPDASPSAR